MKTQTQALIWLEQQLGKSITVNGYSQCVALARAYLRFLDLPQFSSVNAAKQLADPNLQPFASNCNRIAQPQSGALAIWDGSSKNGAGHVNIVFSVGPGYMAMIGQNELNPILGGTVGSPVAMQRWSWPHDRFLTFWMPRFLVDKPAPPALPLPTSQIADTVTLQQPFYGFTNSAAAAALKGSNSQVVPGTYIVTHHANNCVHLKRQDGSGGWWVNMGAPVVSDNSAAATAFAKPTPNSAQRVHIIQPGETYWSIEDRYGLKHGTLQQLNPWPAKAIPKFSPIRLP